MTTIKIYDKSEKPIHITMTKGKKFIIDKTRMPNIERVEVEG